MGHWILKGVGPRMIYTVGACTKSLKNKLKLSVGLAIYLFFTFLTTGFAQEFAPIYLPELEEGRNGASLQGSWVYIAEDDPEIKLPEYKLKNWQIVQVPGGLKEQDLPYREKTGWYRLPLVFPVSMMYQNVALVIGRIGDVDEVYLDGHLIGKTGSFPPYLNIDRNRKRIYPIPAGHVLPNTVQYLSIRVYNHNSSGGILNGPVKIALLDNAYNEFLFAESGKVLIAAVLAIIVIFLNYYYLQRPQIKEILFLMMSILLFASYLVLGNQFLNLLAGSQFIRLKFLSIIIFLLPFTLQGFFFFFLHRNINRIFWIQFALLIPLLLILILTTNYEIVLFSYEEMSLIYLLLIIIIISYYLYKEWKSNSEELRLVAITGAILLISLVNDYFKFNYYWKLVELLPYGFFIFFLSLTFILINRHFQRFQKMESVNRDLEINLIRSTTDFNTRSMLLQQEIDLAFHLKRKIMEAKKIKLDQFRWDIAHKPLWSIGTDYYAMFPLYGGKMAVLLADLLQTGPPAALACSWLRENLDLFVRKRYSINRLYEDIGDLFQEQTHEKKFLSLLMTIDQKNRVISILGNGLTNPIYYSSKDDSFEIIGRQEQRNPKKEKSKNAKTSIRGGKDRKVNKNIKNETQVSAENIYFEQELKIVRGDRIYLFSPGILNATPVSNLIPFGLQRLEQFIVATKKVSVQDLGELLFSELNVFLEGKEQQDDWTFMVFESLS